MITVLAGVNRFLVSEKLGALQTEFIKKYGPAGVERLDGEKLEAGQLSGLITGATLFAEHRLIIIKNIGQNKVAAEALTDLIAKIPDTTHVVLVENQLDKRTVFYKTLKKQAEVLELGELNEAELIAWIIKRTGQLEGVIDQSAARELYSAVGGDQLRLENELAKLVAFNPKITKESIAELVETTPQETVFQLLDVLFGGHKDRVLALLGALEQTKNDPFQLANLLIWQVNILAIVTTSPQTDSEIAKIHKINPYVVSKTRSLGRKLSQNQLRSIVREAAEMDIKLKSSGANPWLVLQQVLIAI